MPIYEYECLACKHRFDEIQGFSDPPVSNCPQCGAKVRKLLFAPAVIFKGSGFYATEYGRSKHSNGTKKGTDSGSTEKTSSTSDSPKTQASSTASPPQVASKAA